MFNTHCPARSECFNFWFSFNKFHSICREASKLAITHTNSLLFNYSFDVRGRAFSKALYWSDTNAFGPRAYFLTVSKPATLSVDNVQLDDEGVSFYAFHVQCMWIVLRMKKKKLRTEKQNVICISVTHMHTYMHIHIIFSRMY